MNADFIFGAKKGNPIYSMHILVLFGAERIMKTDYFVLHFNPVHHIHSCRDTALHKTGKGYL